MSKEVWLKADVCGFTLKNGKLVPIAYCGHHPARESMVFSTLADVNAVSSLECWVKGMVNSSNNILVKGDDEVLAPLGKGDGETMTRYGILINTTRNEYSRDKSVQFVHYKKDAQKLCLLEQRYPECKFSTAELAAAIGLDPARMSEKSLLQLVRVFNAWLSLRKHSLENIDIKGIRKEVDRLAPDIARG